MLMLKIISESVATSKPTLDLAAPIYVGVVQDIEDRGSVLSSFALLIFLQAPDNCPRFSGVSLSCVHFLPLLFAFPATIVRKSFPAELFQDFLYYSYVQ